MQWLTMAMGGIYANDWWRKNLRVTKSTFEALCRELHPFIERIETTFCKPIALEMQIAMMLWKWAINIEYQSLAGLFGVDRSTVSKTILMYKKNFCFPTSTEGIKDIIEGLKRSGSFHKQWELLMEHTYPLSGHKIVRLTIFNGKKYYFIVVQDTCDI